MGISQSKANKNINEETGSITNDKETTPKCYKKSFALKSQCSFFDSDDLKIMNEQLNSFDSQLN